MNVIGYARVSTQGQVDEGVSLQAQEERIRSYCELHGFELTEIVADAGLSGKSIGIRPGLQRILSTAEKGQLQAVVTYKLDRLGRSTLEVLEMVELCDKKDVALHSISEKLDTGSAIGRFVLRTLASLAEMERDLVSERTTAILESKRSRGEKTGGCVPFGYSATEELRDGRSIKVLIPDAEEQKILALIRRLKKKGNSYRAIAVELNRRGHTTKQGQPWTHVQVSRALKAAA